MLRWALRLAGFNMELKWRKGTENVLSDALSRLRCAGDRGPGVDPMSAGDQANRRRADGMTGPILHGVSPHTIGSGVPANPDMRFPAEELAKELAEGTFAELASVATREEPTHQWEPPCDWTTTLALVFARSEEEEVAGDVDRSMLALLQPPAPRAVPLFCGGRGVLVAVEDSTGGNRP